MEVAMAPDHYCLNKGKGMVMVAPSFTVRKGKGHGRVQRSPTKEGGDDHCHTASQIGW